MIIEVDGNRIKPIELGLLTVVGQCLVMPGGQWRAEARLTRAMSYRIAHRYGDMPDDAVRRLLEELGDLHDVIGAALEAADVGCGGEAMMPLDEAAE